MVGYGWMSMYSYMVPLMSSLELPSDELSLGLMAVSRSIACCTLSDSAMYSCGTDEDPRVWTEKKLTLLLQYASLV